jgi:hypothetical protein
VASGEWRVASGEWREASGEWGREETCPLSGGKIGVTELMGGAPPSPGFA